MKTIAGLKTIMKYSVLGIFVPIVVFIFFVPSMAFCLEKLNKAQLKSETGQAGLDIGMDNVVIYHDRDAIKVMNPGDPENNYVSFEKIKGLGTFATGYLDLDSNGLAGKLTIDVANVKNDAAITSDDIPLVFLSCPDWSQNINLSIGNVNWCGKNIGSIDIKNFTLPSWHAYLGVYNGAGIDYELGFRTKIENISFNYGSTGKSLSIKNLQVAGSFTGAPEADPGTWSATGEFKIGNALASTPNPASIDIGIRESDGKAHVQMNLSASGSIRASDMSFGSQSFGPMAIDGIKVHSMKIELPGRGLGGN